MTDMRFNFKGLDEGLKRLERSVRAEVIERVSVKAAEPMARDAKAGAHPGKIKRGTGQRIADKGPLSVTTAVGSRHPLAQIFEFGTRRRKLKSGADRGRIQKIGNVRRAFDKNVGRWFSDIGRRLWREIARGK